MTLSTFQITFTDEAMWKRVCQHLGFQLALKMVCSMSSMASYGDYPDDCK